MTEETPKFDKDEADKVTRDLVEAGANPAFAPLLGVAIASGKLIIVKG